MTPRAPARRSARLTAVALAWAAFAWLPELLVRRSMPLERGGAGVAVYALSLVASFLTWWVLVAGISQLRSRNPALGWAAIAIIGPVGVFLTVASIHYRWYFGTDVRPIAIAYFLQNPGYALTLIRPSLTFWTTGALVAGTSVAIGVLAAITRAERRPPGWAALGAGAALISLTMPTTGLSSYPCVAEVRGIRALALGIREKGLDGHLRALPVPDRVAVAPRPPRASPDIVLVLNESLGTGQIAPWNGAPPTNGGLMDKLGALPGRTVWFPDAVSLAPVTGVSVPSTLSGLAPDARVEDFARAPLLWHEARARGYRTGIFSAQDFTVDFFQGFYLADGGPDESRHAGSHPDAPRVNDRGIPDERTIDDALDFARRAPPDRPMLLVVQMNATHWPCWAPDVQATHIPERCAKAVRYVDAQLGRLVDGLAATRGTDSAVILGTSDHGESFQPARPARAVNYYQEVLQVPLFVHVPAALATASPTLVSTLEANRARRVANVDLFPSVLDIWGAPELDAGRPPLGGASLFRPLEERRPLVAMAETAIWNSLADGFAVFDGRWKWTVDEFHGACLYDLRGDPEERSPRTDALPSDEVARLHATLERHPRAKEIFDRVAPALSTRR